MNINLTPDLIKMIEEKIASGRYATVSEVVREALRLMQEKDERTTARLGQERRRTQKARNKPEKS